MEVAVDTHGDALAGGTDPSRAAAEHEATKWPALVFDLEGNRPRIEIEGDVVVQPCRVVDGSDVVGTSLQSETGPVESLRCNDRRSVTSK